MAERASASLSPPVNYPAVVREGVSQSFIDYKALFKEGSLHDNLPGEEWTKVHIFYGYSGPPGRDDGFEVWAKRAGNMAKLTVTVFMADTVNGADLADELLGEDQEGPSRSARLRRVAMVAALWDALGGSRAPRRAASTTGPLHPGDLWPQAAIVPAERAGPHGHAARVPRRGGHQDAASPRAPFRAREPC